MSDNKIVWASRVLAGSPNAGLVQKKLGVNFNNAASVTVEDVKAAENEATETKRLKKRVKLYVGHKKKAMANRLEVEKAILDLLKAGYDTDVKIELLVRSGLKSSALYQAAVLLQQFKGTIDVAEVQNKHILDKEKAGTKARENANLQQYKHGLTLNQISASYAAKKQLASTKQSANLEAQKNRQAEEAAYDAQLTGKGVSVGGGGGFLAGLRGLFRF